MPRVNGTFSYEIEEHIGDLSEPAGDWMKELNLVSWRDNKPKYDIRSWTADHEKMGKGISLSKSELEQLYNLLKEIFKEG